MKTVFIEPAVKVLDKKNAMYLTLPKGVRYIAWHSVVVSILASTVSTRTLETQFLPSLVVFVLSSRQRVEHQHADGHGANTAGNGADITAQGSHVLEINVA